MKQEIILEFNKKFKMTTPIYKLPDDKKEIIANDNLNKTFQDNILCSNDEYKNNNVPNNNLFNKHVFGIFKKLKQLNIYLPLLLPNRLLVIINIQLLRIIWNEEVNGLPILI